MDRRVLLKTLAAGTLPALALPALTGCGGGGGDAGDTLPAPTIQSFTADKAQYLVGETATVTARFLGARAEIMPGSRPVSDGVPISIGPIGENTTLALIVTALDGRTAFRQITLPVAYRGRWRSVAMGFTRASHAGAELGDGRIAVFGGETGVGVGVAVDVHAFSPQTLAFSRIGTLQSARIGLTATTLGDGRVLVVGAGLLSGAPAGEVFDPALGSSSAAALQSFRSNHGAVLLADGRVLLVGGTPSTATASCELYDPRTNSSRLLANALNMPRAEPVVMRLADGSVLIYGGTSASGGPTPPERFDPATERCELIVQNADPVSQRIRHGLLRNGAGQGFLVGGEDAVAGVPGTAVFSVSADGRSYAAGPAMPRSRSAHTLSPLADGRILAAGGFSTVTSGNLQAVCDLLAADGSGWTTGPSLAVPRALHTAHRLYTGQVLVIGGNDSQRGVIGTAELFD